MVKQTIKMPKKVEYIKFKNFGIKIDLFRFSKYSNTRR